MIVTETQRLTLRRFALSDAHWFLKLVNQPSWIVNIGDRQVHSIADAERYIDVRILSSYAENDFGLYVIESKTDLRVIGVCGLVKRDTLPEPDIGFALFDEHAGHGYAEEAARAVLALAFDQLGLVRLLAITTPNNERSIKLLQKLGFDKEGVINTGGEALCLFVATAR